jgi:hypothetical protein
MRSSRRRRLEVPAKAVTVILSAFPALSEDFGQKGPDQKNTGSL